MNFTNILYLHNTGSGFVDKINTAIIYYVTI